MPLNRDPDDLLLFTPVPAERLTANGWSAEVQRAFIAALARSGVVAHAARSVGKTPRSAYQLRARARRAAGRRLDVPASPQALAALDSLALYSFATAWDFALEIGLGLQQQGAGAAALVPQRVPIVRRGKIVGWEDRFDDRLAIAALGAFNRNRHGPPLPHQRRLARAEADHADAVDAARRLGPMVWPDPPAPPPPEPMPAPIPRRASPPPRRKPAQPRARTL